MRRNEGKPVPVNGDGDTLETNGEAAGKNG